MRGLRFVIRVACALCCATGAAAAPCKTALVLAIDVSGSVDPREYGLQMNGLAAALGDATVRQALIEAGALVSVLQWSGATRQRVSVPWTAIASDDDVDWLKRAVTDAPRAWRNYSTAIGDALATAAAMLGEVSGRCDRQVIDVSGDGVSNEGRNLEPMRDALVRGGVQINGLAIEIGEEGLTDYFRRSLIGGGGAFVMTAKDFEDYPRAIRRKLLRELTDPVVEAAPPFLRASSEDSAGRLRE